MLCVLYILCIYGIQRDDGSPGCERIVLRNPHMRVSKACRDFHKPFLNSTHPQDLQIHYPSLRKLNMYMLHEHLQVFLRQESVPPTSPRLTPDPTPLGINREYSLHYLRITQGLSSLIPIETPVSKVDSGVDMFWLSLHQRSRKLRSCHHHEHATCSLSL